MNKDNILVAVAGVFAIIAFIMASGKDWNNVEQADKKVEAAIAANEARYEEARLAKVTPTATPTAAPTATPEATKKPQKAYRYIKGCGLKKATQRRIFDICEKKNISYEFVMAVIYTESSFRPNAVSDNGQSVGLMQIQERWHKPLMDKLGVDSLYNPVDNVKVGVELLASYFKKKNDTYYALMRYNGGEAYANRKLAAGEVSDYAKKVLRLAEKYERQNGI